MHGLKPGDPVVCTDTCRRGCCNEGEREGVVLEYGCAVGVAWYKIRLANGRETSYGCESVRLAQPQKKSATEC